MLLTTQHLCVKLSAVFRSPYQTSETARSSSSYVVFQTDRQTGRKHASLTCIVLRPQRSLSGHSPATREQKQVFVLDLTWRSWLCAFVEESQLQDHATHPLVLRACEAASCKLSQVSATSMSRCYRWPYSVSHAAKKGSVSEKNILSRTLLAFAFACSESTLRSKIGKLFPWLRSTRFLTKVRIVRTLASAVSSHGKLELQTSEIEISLALPADRSR